MIREQNRKHGDMIKVIHYGWTSKHIINSGGCELNKYTLTLSLWRRQLSSTFSSEMNDLNAIDEGGNAPHDR